MVCIMLSSRLMKLLSISINHPPSQRPTNTCRTRLRPLSSCRYQRNYVFFHKIKRNEKRRNHINFTKEKKREAVTYPPPYPILETEPSSIDFIFIYSLDLVNLEKLKSHNVCLSMLFFTCKSIFNRLAKLFYENKYS
jgi:hypothetical protein